MELRRLTYELLNCQRFMIEFCDVRTLLVDGIEIPQNGCWLHLQRYRLDSLGLSEVGW